MRDHILNKSKLLLSNSLVRYLIVGGSSVVVEVFSFNILLYVLQIQPLYSNMISFVIGAAFNFTMSNYWTFRAGGEQKAQKIGKYLALLGFNYVVNNVIFYCINSVLGVHPVITKILVIALQTSWTFLIYKFWVFKPKAVTT